VLLSTPAFASGGGGSGGDLPVVVALVTIVGVAYLLTHFVVDWLQRLFLVATSIEYLLLGVLLGLIFVPDTSAEVWVQTIQHLPLIEGLPWPKPLDDLTPIAPLIALAAGWVGLLYGMALDVPSVLGKRDGAVRLAVLEGALTATPVTLAAYLLLNALSPESPQSGLWLCAGLLGVTAWAGSTSAMDVVKRRYNVEGTTLSSLVRAARYSDMLAVLTFGVLFCLFHGAGSIQAVASAIPDPAANRPPTAAEWSMITVGTGLVLGGLFAWYLDEDDSEAGTFLALVGIIAFASGAAFFLELSALTINLVLGMVLVNISRSGEKVRTTLRGTLKPMSLLLLLLAGAMWDPPPLLLTAGLVVAVIGVRALGKIAAGWMSSFGTDLRRDSFRGLIGQGEVTIAMAISFKLVYDVAGAGEIQGAIDATYTAILVGVVVHEIIAPRVLKGLLVDAGEITVETGLGG
jgi:hypothetical protein